MPRPIIRTKILRNEDQKSAQHDLINNEDEKLLRELIEATEEMYAGMKQLDDSEGCASQN